MSTAAEKDLAALMTFLGSLRADIAREWPADDPHGRYPGTRHMLDEIDTRIEAYSPALSGVAAIPSTEGPQAR